jgi:hypothetical protein
MTIDVDRLNEYVDELKTKTEESNNQINDLINQINQISENLAVFIENGYSTELKNKKHNAIGYIDDNLFVDLFRSEQSINRKRSPFAVFAYPVKTLNTIKFDKVCSGINLDVPVVPVKDMIKLLKTMRPMDYDGSGHERGRFSLDYAFVRSDGTSSMAFRLCDGYALSQPVLNRKIAEMIVNDYYSLKVKFTTNNYMFQNRWVELYVNPNEYVRCLYELSTL